MLKSVFFYLFLMLMACSFAELKAQKNTVPPFITPASVNWADSVFNTMTAEEKIGQLFMVAAFSNKDQIDVNEIKDLITNYHIGGLTFFQGGPLRQAALTNYYQEISKIPLMISIDGQWGLSMRLDSTIRFPRAMTLGAMPSDSLVYQMGLEIARQCKEMGIHVNFGLDEPVAHFLRQQPDVSLMQAHIEQFLAHWLENACNRNHRSYVTVAVGCTGGQHRSVYLVERLADVLSSRWATLKRHRELDGR